MKIKVKVILPNGFSYDWTYVGESLSVGRDPECDMAIEDSDRRFVSWMHARIEGEDNGALLRDFNSKNGTYVNGERVDRTAALGVGDKIRLGRKGPQIIVLDLDATAAADGDDQCASDGAPGDAPSEEPSTTGEPLDLGSWMLRASVIAFIVAMVFLTTLLWLLR